MKRRNFLAGIILFTVLCVSQMGIACTNLLVTRGASSDGSTMITYAADSHVRYGELRYHPATNHMKGEMLRVYDYGTLKFRMEIPEVAHTYSVVGFINEHQLAIGETTWGGIKELENGNAQGIDYGSLIYITLQRARNCREAIQVIAELTATYGYASGGESFSISDPQEVWIMEIIDKGEELGAVWVARRVPEGYVCGHANQARITTFPLEQKKSFKSISSKNLSQIKRAEVECVYSDDVITFARKKGYFSGKDEEFSFSDTYNPVTFSGARACDARVYAMFNRINSNMKQYEDYAMGKNLTNRMPLWIKPDKKLSLHDVMNLMRDHFEGTPMDMTQDVGAGPFHCPYRWRPMDWEYEGHTYVHERAISTQQTGFSFVAQCRSKYADKFGGILWFGVDDTYSTVYCPIYCGVTEIPECFRAGNGSMTEYSETAAFWLFNRVTNFVYTRYDAMIADLMKVQRKLESQFMREVVKFDDGLNQAPTGVDITASLNAFAAEQASTMMNEWNNLDKYLLVKYIDGNIKKEKNGEFSRTPYGMAEFPSQPKYPESFYREIVKDHGNVVIEK